MPKTPKTGSVPPANFTLEQLAISPLNVRFNEEDCAAVEALSASIVAEGLLQPLVLHPAPKGADWAGTARFGVLAGGRRYRAIRRAIEAGELPADFPIAATVHDLPDGAIILMSLSENLLRRNLRDYEVHRAIAAAHAEGLGVDAIARQTGQTVAFVGQQLRLGTLHPDVFAAYVAGDLAPDQARAYAATDDQALQAECFAHFRPLPRYEHSARNIHAFLRVGDRELARQLLFVGEAIYRARGGRYELDLFAEGSAADRGRVVDEDLLHELVEEKLDTLRAQIRAALGERDLRFASRAPQYGGHDDTMLELPLPRGGWPQLRLPREGTVADFVAVIELGDEGEWRPRFFWESRKARADRRRGDTHSAAPTRATSAITPTEGEALGATRGDAYDTEARRIVRDEHGLTSDGLDVVRSLRRDLLRAMLVDDAADWLDGQQLGRHYLTWSSLRIELGKSRDSQTGARGLAAEGWTESQREPRELLRDHRDGQLGWAGWTRALARVEAHPAFSLEDCAAALEAYLDAEGDFHAMAEAVLAGRALLRSANTPGWRVAAHDVLARRLGVTAPRLRELWEPNTAFVGMFGKLPRLALAQPFVETAAFTGWSKLKDKPLTGAVTAALQGLQGGSEAEAAKAWVHPLLTFEPTVSASVDAQEPAREPEHAL